MKLYYSSTSPFVRKINVFAIEVGLDKNIEWVKTNPWLVEDVLTAENPLSQVPTLITDDGLVLYDSSVICEYLDSLHSGEKLIPQQGMSRWLVLRLQALADGILNAGILRFLEKKRVSEKQSVEWDTTNKKSVQRSLDYLESTVADWGDNLDVGVLSIACVLGWLDFRFANEDWRATHPKLSNWFEQFSKRPSLIQTMPAEPVA